MITRDDVVQLARTYGFNADALYAQLEDVWTILAVKEVWESPNRQETLRKVRGRLRRDASDTEAWVDATRVLRGQRIVAWRRGEILVTPSARNRMARTKEDKYLNAAVAHLGRVWVRFQHDRRFISMTPGIDGTRMRASAGIEFVGAVLRGLGVHSTKTSPAAIFHRMQRIHQSMLRAEKSMDLRLDADDLELGGIALPDGYVPDTENATVRRKRG